ncbi:MAG TPA: hypothetical protein VH951_03860, partial [Dehalococcoidia bacterium]
HFLMSSKGPRDMGALREGAAAGGLQGEPQQVIDKMGQYIQGGAQRINIAIRPPVDWEALQEYIEDVMPAFR